MCPTESKQTLKGWPCFRGALHSKYSKSHKKVQKIQKTLALAYKSMFLKKGREWKKIEFPRQLNWEGFLQKIF